MMLYKTYLKIVRLLLLAVFVTCALHLIITFIHFIINPFIDNYLIGFTWLGFLISIIELLYCIWFCEYYYENSKGE